MDINNVLLNGCHAVRTKIKTLPTLLSGKEPLRAPVGDQVLVLVIVKDSMLQPEAVCLSPDPSALVFNMEKTILSVDSQCAKEAY